MNELPLAVVTEEGIGPLRPVLQEPDYRTLESPQKPLILTLPVLSKNNHAIIRVVHRSEFLLLHLSKKVIVDGIVRSANNDFLRRLGWRWFEVVSNFSARLPSPLQCGAFTSLLPQVASRFVTGSWSLGIVGDVKGLG